MVNVDQIVLAVGVILSTVPVLPVLGSRILLPGLLRVE